MKPGRFFSFVRSRYEDGGITGVCRFDNEIRKVFSGIRSVTSLPTDLDPSDIVVTDNHLSLEVPKVIRTLVVHHGCAKTHWERDPHWRTTETTKIVADQARMLDVPNRYWITLSRWTRGEFSAHYKLSSEYATVIPLWVPAFGPAPRRQRARPVVIGDWRNWNKGSEIAGRLREACPEIEWRQLNFRPAEYQQFYLDADLYLCLSASEGASYAMADAEACGLPIVTTDTGLFNEHADSRVIPWQRREDIDFVIDTVRQKLQSGRQRESLYEKYRFEDWADRWMSLSMAIFAIRGGPQVKVSPVKWSPGKKLPAGATIVVGMGGGLGNSLFNLPLLKALKELGHRVIGYVQTDYPAAEFWGRCRYLDAVVGPDDPTPTADLYVAGPWCPVELAKDSRVHRYVWKREPEYPEPEWSLIFRAARDLGWTGDPPPIDDWCRDLAHVPRWDVGIVQGCKPQDLWRRKRYPKMPEVAQALTDLGLRVCVFGTEDDRDAVRIPGEDSLGRYELADLPDALAGCRLVIGTDSGVTQLAAALGVPTIVIYTATSTMKGSPVGSSATKVSAGAACSPCQGTPAWRQCRNWICQDIPTEAVVEAAVRILQVEAARSQ